MPTIYMSNFFYVKFTKEQPIENVVDDKTINQLSKIQKNPSNN